MNMSINTFTRRSTALAAGVLLALGTAYPAASYASEIPLKVTFVGAGIETAVDSNADGLKMSLTTAEAKGSFGAAMVYITSEFRVEPTTPCPAGFLPLYLFHSTAILTFSNGDQLYGFVSGGEMCLNLSTGYYYGDATGVYHGGTGRFANATGTFLSTYTGHNLEPFVSGFRSIQGKIEGTVSRK
jgi:hypothetical protein